MSLVVGDDGLARCAWGAGSPDYRAYHDLEWGKPVRGDRALFERLTLEAFQSGLSWITILRKRENFRSAFANFDLQVVGAFTDADRERLMADLAAQSPASKALSKALKKRGFVFIGPTTMHAAMQAIGVIDDHLVGCSAVR